MMDAEKQNEELKQQLVENFDFEGGWTGSECSGSIYGIRRDLEAREMTMLIRNSYGLDLLVYINLIPSSESRHYDAWIRRAGEEDMHLLFRCKAADLEEMEHQLMLNFPELI